MSTDTRDSDEYLTFKEAAALLGCHPRTVRRAWKRADGEWDSWIDEARQPSARVVAREDIERYAERRGIDIDEGGRDSERHLPATRRDSAGDPLLRDYMRRQAEAAEAQARRQRLTLWINVAVSVVALGILAYLAHEALTMMRNLAP